MPPRIGAGPCHQPRVPAVEQERAALELEAFGKSRCASHDAVHRVKSNDSPQVRLVSQLALGPKTEVGEVVRTKRVRLARRRVWRMKGSKLGPHSEQPTHQISSLPQRAMPSMPALAKAVALQLWLLGRPFGVWFRRAPSRPTVRFVAPLSASG